MNIRVQEYGVTSYWPQTMSHAERVVAQIIERNGCGNIQQKQPNGTWKITHRFERHTGLVEA